MKKRKNKCQEYFFNSQNNSFYKTLNEAKASSTAPFIYRCWLLYGDVRSMSPLVAYGCISR